MNLIEAHIGVLEAGRRMTLAIVLSLDFIALRRWQYFDLISERDLSSVT
jgi:hypothetical protein